MQNSTATALEERLPLVVQKDRARNQFMADAIAVAAEIAAWESAMNLPPQVAGALDSFKRSRARYLDVCGVNGEVEQAEARR